MMCLKEVLDAGFVADELRSLDAVGPVDPPEETEAEGIDDEVNDRVDVEAATLEAESATYS